MAKSWNQEFEALIQVHKLPYLQRQITLHAQKIHMHVQSMFPPFYIGLLKAPIQLAVCPFYSLL
jgi:ferric iron reductase protein FhuF